MKNFICLFVFLIASSLWSIHIVCGQITSDQLLIIPEKIQAWDTEINLDTIDMEKMPKIVTGGVFAAANLSNFLITSQGEITASYMRFGADIGGLLDFRVTKHFAIQGRLIITAEENYVKGLHFRQQLWSFGMDIPVFFIGRFGNLNQGYFQFGLGPFTHFTFASNISAYTNNPAKKKVAIQSAETKDYTSLYKLHDNHSGLAATIGYEFSIGVLLLFNYQVSISDIVTYYSDNGGIKNVNAAIYPHRLSLGVGYRWK